MTLYPHFITCSYFNLAELHPSAFMLISSLIFERPESASVKMKDGLAQSQVSTIVHAFGRTLGSTALVIASAALMQRLVFPTILLSTSHNEHKSPVKMKTRPSPEKPVKWCSMLSAAFVAAALTLVAIDLDIIDPTGSKTIPVNIDEYLNVEVSTPTVRRRRGRETVPKIDRDWREADPSGLGVVNGLSLLPNDVLDSDPTGSRATNLLSPALRNNLAVEQQNQFHMWAFTSESQLKILSTSGPIAGVIDSSQIPGPKREDAYTSSNQLIQSVFQSPSQAPSALSTFADWEPSIAAFLCVLVSHLVLVSSLVVLALLTRSRTPSGDPPSDLKWQPTSVPPPTSMRSSRLLSTAFAVQLTGFLALRTAGIVLNASASKRAPKSLSWSGSFGLNDALALAVAIAWLALCVARVFGRCCTRTRQVDVPEFPENPTDEATFTNPGEGTLALQNPERLSSSPPPHSSQPAAGSTSSSASVALPAQASSQTRVENTLVDGRRVEAQRARGVWQRVLSFWRQSSSGVASRDGRFRRGEAIDDVDLNQEAEPAAASAPQPSQCSNSEPKSNVGVAQKTLVNTTKTSQPTTALKPSSPEEKGAERVEQPAVTINCVNNAVPCSSQSKPSQKESKSTKKAKLIKAPTLREDTLVEGKPSAGKVTKANKQENFTNATSKSETLPNKVEPINKKQSEVENEKKNSKALKCKGGPAVSSTKLAVAVGESTEKNVKKNVTKEAAASSKHGKKQKAKREPTRPAALEHKSGTQLQAGPLKASDGEQSRRELMRPENKQDSSAAQARNTQGPISSVAATRPEAQAAQPQQQGDARPPASAHAKRNATGAQENSTVEAQGKRNSGHTLDTSASAATRASGQAATGAAGTGERGGGPTASGKQSQVYIKHSDSTQGGAKHGETAARADKFKHSDSSHSLRGRHAEIGGATAAAIVRHREKEERQKGKYREERRKDGGSVSGPLAITDFSQSRSSRSGTSNNAAVTREGESGRARRASLMSEQKRSSNDEAMLRSHESKSSSDTDECNENVFAALPVPNPHKHPCAYPKSHFKSLEREREHTAKRLAALNAAPPVIVAPLPPYVPRRKSKRKKRRLQRGDGVDEEEDEEEEEDATSAEEDARAVRPTDLAVPKMVV